jgi:hypothetical protein
MNSFVASSPVINVHRARYTLATKNARKKHSFMAELTFCK